MMKKNLIDTIKKLAQSIDDPMPVAPTRRTPRTPVTPKEPISYVPGRGHSGSATSGHGFSASPAVKEMQQAILNLANIASSTDVTAMDGNKDGQMEGKQSRQAPAVSQELADKDQIKGRGFMGDEQQQELANQTKNDKNYLGGSDAFGKFLVQNYIGKDSFIGRQYLNTDVAGQSNREHASTNPTNLRGIIDTIKRVGSPNAKGEKTVDGIWQTRTNNSLQVIGDLIEAVLGLSNDMGVKLTAYTPENLAYFRKYVPDTWTAMKSNEDVNERATALTKHLNAMSKLFQQFNQSVVNNQQIRKFIDQKEAFVSIPKQTTIPGNMMLGGIPGLQFDWIKTPAQNWISIQDLSNIENFKKFVRRVGQDESNPETVKNILEDISNKLNVDGQLQEKR